MVKCEICNKELVDYQALSNHLTRTHKYKDKKLYYDTYIKTEDEGKCKTCGKPTSFIKLSAGYRTYCGHSCVFLNEESLFKYRTTMKERYGFEHFLQNKETQDKIHQTEGYKNRECSWSKPEVVKKLSIIRTNKINKFEQNNNCTASSKICSKYNSIAWQILDLPVIKYGKDNFVENKYLDIIDTFMSYINTTNERATTIIKDNNNYAENYIIARLVEIYDDEIILHDRSSIKPFEIDIYLPKLNLGIEYNGLYWHSTEAGRIPDRHLQKSIMCKNKNIRLIHIYEFESIIEQTQLLIDLIQGNDNYAITDYNKNNLLPNLESIKPYLYTITDNNAVFHIHTVGKLK